MIYTSAAGPPQGLEGCGKAPDFNDATVSPLPPLLLSPKGTLGKADGSRLECWPNPWRRPVLAGAQRYVWLQDSAGGFTVLLSAAQAPCCGASHRTSASPPHPCLVLSVPTHAAVGSPAGLHCGGAAYARVV